MGGGSQGNAAALLGCYAACLELLSAKQVALALVSCAPWMPDAAALLEQLGGCGSFHKRLQA